MFVLGGVLVLAPSTLVLALLVRLYRIGQMWGMDCLNSRLENEGTKQSFSSLRA